MSTRWSFFAVLAVAFVARLGVLVWRAELLDTDPDGYVALAEGLLAGRGYVDPATGEPTAFRPPAYPVLLVPTIGLFGRRTGIAVTQIVASLVIVTFTWMLGRRFGLGRGATIAAGIVAIEPLLLLYTAYPMTEVVFTAFVAGLLFAVDDAVRRPCGWRSLAVGFVFAMTSLCRPTVWAFGLLAVLVLGVPRLGDRKAWRHALLIGVGCAAGLAPWVVRNAIVLGRPVVMTTHGGYTLLLGNNPVFRDEVVRQPWGTVWSGESLDRWQESLDEEMSEHDPPIRGELARDRWHRDRAMDHITGDPAGFVAASVLRLRRLWNPVPLVSGTSTAVVWTVGAFEILLFVLAALGLVLIVRGKRTALTPWWPAILFVLSLTAVHAVYWSNARMRSPAVPILALLAGRVVTGRAAVRER